MATPINNTLDIPKPTPGLITQAQNPIMGGNQYLTPETSAAGQLKGLVSQNSPYLQSAANYAQERMSGRGLVNSSISAGAGTRAAIDAATPLAQSDASMAGVLRQQQQNAENQLKRDTIQNTYDLNKQKSAQEADIAKQKSAQEADIAKQNTSIAADIAKQKSAQEADIAKQKLVNDANLAREQLVQDASMNRLNVTNKNAIDKALLNADNLTTRDFNTTYGNMSQQLTQELARIDGYNMDDGQKAQAKNDLIKSFNGNVANLIATTNASLSGFQLNWDSETSKVAGGTPITRDTYTGNPLVGQQSILTPQQRKDYERRDTNPALRKLTEQEYLDFINQ